MTTVPSSIRPRFWYVPICALSSVDFMEGISFPVKMFSYYHPTRISVFGFKSGVGGAGDPMDMIL